jgi:hypothetical protein
MRWHRDVEFAETVGHHAAIEADGEFTSLQIDVRDVADVAVVDLPVVVGFLSA